MDRDTFWNLIDRCRPSADDEYWSKHCGAVIEELSREEPAAIVEFDRILWALVREAYSAPLWSVVSFLGVYCSDDGFTYFRLWLVLQGRDVYETVLAAPDYLGEIQLNDRDMVADDFMNVASAAYERRTGEEMPEQKPLKREKLKGRFIRTAKGFRRRFPALWKLEQNRPEIDPHWLRWREGLVGTIADQIEGERRWGELPALADALEEAGCADRLILDHLRAGTRHARTCWVINGLKGRW
jgi:hypothetical protein